VRARVARPDAHGELVTTLGEIRRQPQQPVDVLAPLDLGRAQLHEVPGADRPLPGRAVLARELALDGAVGLAREQTAPRRFRSGRCPPPRRPPRRPSGPSAGRPPRRRPRARPAPPSARRGAPARPRPDRPAPSRARPARAARRAARRPRRARPRPSRPRTRAGRPTPARPRPARARAPPQPRSASPSSCMMPRAGMLTHSGRLASSYPSS
jgi:hypothetical protein